MLKQTFSVLILAMAVSTVSAAEVASSYNKEDRIVGASLGFGMAGVYGDAGIPPIGVIYEQGINDNISVGGIVAYSSSEIRYFGGWGFDYTYILIGARGEYHRPFIEGIDTYAGLLLGYNIVSATEVGNAGPGFSAGASYLALGGNVGARKWFTPKIGGQLELGYGAGLASVGVIYKL